MNHHLERNKLTLYYNKYRYKICFYLPGIHYFRYTKTVEAMENQLKIEVQDAHDKHYSYRTYVYSAKFSYLPLIQLLSKNFSGDKIIRDYFNWYETTFSETKKEHKRIIAHNNLTLYTNDKSDIQSAIEHNPDSEIVSCYVDPKPDYERGKIYHLQPKHKYRVYFSLRRINEKPDLDKFKQFLIENDCVLSHKLKRDIYRTNPRNFINSSYFLLLPSHYIDINDEKIVTMLSLTFGDYIGKIADILPR